MGEADGTSKSETSPLSMRLETFASRPITLTTEMERLRSRTDRTTRKTKYGLAKTPLPTTLALTAASGSPSSETHQNLEPSRTTTSCQRTTKTTRSSMTVKITARPHTLTCGSSVESQSWMLTCLRKQRASSLRRFLATT